MGDGGEGGKGGGRTCQIRGKFLMFKRVMRRRRIRDLWPGPVRRVMMKSWISRAFLDMRIVVMMDVVTAIKLEIVRTCCILIFAILLFTSSTFLCGT
jgi:hypothetical protein